MASYYNEIDPFAAAWLRELITAGLIADGEVDDRSIELVSADDVRGFRQCHFFAGIGGWSYALRLAGWSDDREAWTGSCPCQPWSMAGRNAGSDDPRHLWPTWFRLIRECRPPVVFGEQVSSADGLYWLDLVYADMEATDYAIGAVDCAAAGIGAPHGRPRLYFVGRRGGADADSGIDAQRRESQRVGRQWGAEEDAAVLGQSGSVWARESRPRTLADGVSGRMDQLRGFGNAIVPQVAQVFIESYLEARGFSGRADDPPGAR